MSATLTRNETTADLREVLSQANGGFVVSLLLPGKYRAEVTKPGFKTTVQPGVTISVTETARLDVTLEVGAVQEQVTVSTEVALLQTESSALGRVTDHQQVSDLPLVARNFTQIVTLSPGIEANVNNASDLGRGSGGTSQGNFRAHGAEGAEAGDQPGIARHHARTQSRQAGAFGQGMKGEKTAEIARLFQPRGQGAALLPERISVQSRSVDLGGSDLVGLDGHSSVD